MEDDPKNSGGGNDNDNDNDNDERTGNSSDTDQERGGALLLQVTMAAADTEEKNEIVADPTAYPSNESKAEASTSRTMPSDSIGISGADDEYVLRRPSSAASSDKSLQLRIEQDFQELSEAERQQVYFDMRGEIFKAEKDASPDSNSSPARNEAGRFIASPVSESDLAALNVELLRLLESSAEQENNPFYQTVFKTLTNSGSDLYANSAALRSKLLRAEHRDVKKAAKRTADFFSLLCELFGEKLLSRPMRLSDLSPTERQLQRKGFQQLFRFRDQSEYRKAGQELKQGSERQKLQDLDSGAGRRIAGSFDLCRCVSTNEPTMDDETSKTRVLLYLMQVASDDEETQTQGIVFIFMLALRAVHNLLSQTTNSAAAAAESVIPIKESQPVALSLPQAESDSIFGNDSTSESDNHSDEQLLAQLQFSPHESTNRHNHTITRIRVLSRIFRSGPLRVSAIHVCSPNRQELEEIKMDFLKALSRHERVRTRFHNGTSMECSLSLNKVGIPTDRLPLKYDGTIKTEDHLQWIAIQEAKESAAKKKRAFDIVECPMNMDILSGRGQLVRSHPGNVSFRKDFIRARSARYDMASNREEKNAIADEILEDISTLKRKFLKQHQGAGYWTELDKKTAKEKVMMAFREFRKSQRNQQQHQQLRKARSNPHLQQQSAQQHQLHQARPSLPLSQSLPHSPVTQTASQQRRSQSRSPSTLHGHHDAAQAQRQLQQQQQQQTEQHQQASIHYQLYPPGTGSVAGLPSEGFHHPPHHLVAIPPPALSYYAPHPPMPPHPHHPLSYGHPLPPHLLPPTHHSPYPPLAHSEHANIRPPSGSNQSDAAVAAAYNMPPSSSPQVAGYHHHQNYFPTNSHPSSRQSRTKDETESGDDADERSYKRYKLL
eukprot:CAMPEP_0116092902 /NCGR_PEP_ID=MMETSP0327-20121206/8293_1 /TAXON_ID=44447 /ORGANISM="Pseudo-nitzschia delicatissima, Strain B596" /LENGTH=888 /DNA_ID=CAMNT_0003584365 /DNA_START=505 /DNA_END=3171 /DNA_ORIENTATION=+